MTETSMTKFGWSSNPFVLKIYPELFTGYIEQSNAAKRHIEEKHKIALVSGPTGSGKTTMLKWLEMSYPGSIFVSKPPETSEGFVSIFLDKMPLTFFERIFRKKVSLFNLPQYVNSKSKGKHIVLLIDEAHETSKEVLEWLRVLTDQIDSISLFIAGLPVLEKKVRDELETFNQRITTRIILGALSKTEMKEMIEKRIKFVGGSGIGPFTDDAIDKIYDKTGGFPREVIKICDRLVSEAIIKDLNSIDIAALNEFRETKENVRVEEPTTVSFSPLPPSKEQLFNLPFKQRKILELLAKTDWLTPASILENADFENYKSRGHAVRSINNILHRLMLDGYVQREARGKAFMYALTPKVRTLFVEA